MQGGEIFVPKIPSVKVTDLAQAMAPNLSQYIIGIRPGEKVHEIMCPSDSSHLTLEFEDHYVIMPTIEFSVAKDYRVNRCGESGKAVGDSFEYNSGTNSHFLSIAEIAAINSAEGYSIESEA
jgi:UDP-N-acetylglucosamine 4,6-dehydratase